MAKLKKIGILFFAKLQGLVFGFVGLLAGIGYSFGGFFYELFTDSLNSGTAIAFLALVGMPAIFGTLGLVVGAVEALVYNFLARWFGGLEIDLVSDQHSS